MTNAPTGTSNTPADIPAGQPRTHLVAFTPTAAFGPTDVSFAFAGDNTASVGALVGINTFLLSASPSLTPDIVALAATLNGDGIVHIPGATGTGVFAVATVNVGASGSITVSADTGSPGAPAVAHALDEVAGGGAVAGRESAASPVSVSLCQTDPGSGQCIGTPAARVTVQIGKGQPPTFGIFVTGLDVVPFDPAAHRIFVRFEDGGNVTRGSTSVAVRTN